MALKESPPIPGILASFKNRLQKAVPPVLTGQPSEVTEFLELGKTSSLLGGTKPAEIDDRKLAFQNGIKKMSELGPKSLWTLQLQEAALVLLHNAERTPRSGKAEYIQKLPKTPPPTVKPEDVWRELLSVAKDSTRKDHPNEISGLVYACLSLVSLCLYRTKSQDSKVNDTSPYLDLSPLYGCTREETDSIRLLDGRGMLYPDCFVDDRVWLLPPAVAALLVLWNRNHNFMAQSLFVRCAMEKGWKPYQSLSTADRRGQDNIIFDLARQINAIQFRNIVSEDLLKGFLGLSSYDPSAYLDVLVDVGGHVKGEGLDSHLESSFLYHWSSMMPKSDVSIVNEAVKEIVGDSSDCSPAKFRQLRSEFLKGVNGNPTTCHYPRLPRNARDGHINDEDLARIILKATDESSCAPGSKQMPPCVRIFELDILEDGRTQQVCTFNDFRKFYGLKALTSFTAWNPDPKISAAAENLYGHIDKLELYPGLECEAVTPNGFGLGYTKTFATIVDLVARIRMDPSVTKEDAYTLTNWGFSETRISRSGPAYGAVLPKLLQRHLPQVYPINSMCTSFPFSTPSASASRKAPKQNPFSDYTDEKPAMKTVHTLSSIQSIKYVFNKSEKYSNPYADSLMRLTDGYGYLLGFENNLEHLHDQDQLMTMYALIPDAGSLDRYSTVFGQMTEAAIERHQRYRQGSGGRREIDIVEDVINEVCTRWVCETLCDYKLADESSSSAKSAESNVDVKAKARTAKEMHKAFASLYTYIFKAFEQGDGWDAQQRAMESSQWLRRHVESKIPKPKWLLSRSYDLEWIRTSFAAMKKDVWDLVEIYFFQKILPASTAQTFLERAVQASRSIPTPKIHTVPHLNQKIIDAKSKSKGKLSQKRQDEVEREIEVSRIVANILGLSAVTAVNYSQACAQVVDFYLQDEYTTEREEIVALSQDTNSDDKRRESNAILAQYIHEALRISQPLGLWREAVEDDEIEQGTERIIVRKGDHIFADFNEAHKNMFADPEKVDIKREKVKSLLGLGIHRCPASSFIDSTMPEVIRAIFKLPNLSRARDNAYSQLNMVQIHPGPSYMHRKVYLNKDGEVTSYPQTMILEYNESIPKGSVTDEEFAKTWQAGQVPNTFRTITKKSEQGLAISFTLYVLYKLILILLALWALIMLFFFGPLGHRPVKIVTMADIQVLNVECPEPIAVWEAWTIATLPAGSAGIPQNLTYASSLETAHRLQIYDADKKDMRMAVYVDGILRGLTTDFDLDREEDCGADVYQCYLKKFSGGIVVVPPGKHTVAIGWAGKEVVNETIPDLGEDTSRRILWNKDFCGPPVQRRTT